MEAIEKDSKILQETLRVEQEKRNVDTDYIETSDVEELSLVENFVNVF